MGMYDLRDVIALVRHASMSTTYKPALLKSLVRIAARGPSLVIPLTVIGREFATLYWNQTIVFHLRQAAVLSKEPEVIKSIRKKSADYQLRELKNLPQEAAAAIDREMARILTINVLERFHAGKPTSMPPLFTWRPSERAVTLSDGSHAFLRDQRATLEVIANYWWASYLEKVNVLAPAIIEKVRRDGAQRSSLAKYLRILTTQTGEDRYFYCDIAFSDQRRVSVNHLLPWTFLLDDPLWDLVLACAQCNGSKSDRLPDARFVTKLAGRNHVRSKLLAPRLASPLIDDAKLFQLYDAAVALEWPGGWQSGQPA